MRSVGIKNLKNRLSEYVHLAADGETVLVTERDRVVAELAPPGAGRSPRGSDAVLAEAVRNGWVTPPLLTGMPLPPRKPLVPFHRLRTDLEGDRADR